MHRRAWERGDDPHRGQSFARDTDRCPQRGSLGNDHRRIAEIVDHPFFASTDLRLAGILNDGNAVVTNVESRWEPLAPVPDSAWAAVPPDASFVSPWRATTREVAELYRLVDAGRAHAGLV